MKIKTPPIGDSRRPFSGFYSKEDKIDPTKGSVTEVSKKFRIKMDLYLTAALLTVIPQVWSQNKKTVYWPICNAAWIGNLNSLELTDFVSVRFGPILCHRPAQEELAHPVVPLQAGITSAVSPFTHSRFLWGA